MRYVWIVTIVIVCVVNSAPAWHDTEVRMQTSEPLVAAFEAETGRGTVDVRKDAQANGGRGGWAVLAKPGKTLCFQMRLDPSIYSFWIVARAPKGAPDGAGKDARVFANLDFTSPDGSIHTWTMPVHYREDYAVIVRMYFPVHNVGECRFRVGLTDKSKLALLCDRVEVRDVLGHCAREGVKTRRMLSGDDELKRIRAEFHADPRHNDRTWNLGKDRGDVWRFRARRFDDRRRDADKLWESLPDWNTMHADPSFKTWHHVIGRDCPGKVADLARIYHESGDEEAGWDGAVLLCAVAEKYPGLDHYFQGFDQARDLRWGQMVGKSVYSGWAGGDLMRLATSYDRLFDYIRDNQSLADYVHTRIDWIRTPHDVITYLDTHVLQHGMDCLKRRIIRSDEAAALIPLVQGINDVSRRMLTDNGGLFDKVHIGMAHVGGIDDQAFTAYSRGGVRYIGSTGYVSPRLKEIADILTQYVRAGGDPRFNLNDPGQYPQLRESFYTKNGLYAAGGFPIIVGDSMDLTRGREADRPAYSSRVLEGFGEVVLEAGQEAANPRVKRAVAIHTGIGRGHAHQDTLNLEIFAHGCRLAPDLGGRHAGKNASSPNMRRNRMHNVVWIDDEEFCNTFSGSTTSGTGWTTSFSPREGVQYTANSARATSHPQVTLYHRATAMIDGQIRNDAADVYIFDVFRVRGGKRHVYCFHGAYGRKVTSNIDLRPAASAIAKEILRSRPEDSLFEGRTSDPFVITWPMRADLQARYQGEKHYTPDWPVALTLTLLGHENEGVYIGNARSEVYPVDMPYLHVLREKATGGLTSVYPAVMECHAGPRFIRELRELDVTPASSDVNRGIALAVSLNNGREDSLFASLKPQIRHTLSDGTTVAGEFGFISRDEKGPRIMHLVGGTHLAQGKASICCSKPAFETSIHGVDYVRRSLTLTEALPAKLPDGQVTLIGNDFHRDAFEMTTASGKHAKFVRTPRYYQSKIDGIDASRRLIFTELEPAVYGCDTDFIKGTTVTNEAHDQSWKARLYPIERWMYLGWPGTDLSYPREVTLDDLPDADGDGKRELRLMGRGTDSEPAGVRLEMEITRVDPNEHLFYFAMPDDPNYQIGGWQYANRELVNEDGSKSWWATYPGTVWAWQLEGDGPLGEADFADIDGDGKRKLYAYHFGRGDRVQFKTFVYLSRQSEGLYRVRANTGCTISLPAPNGAEVRISSDNRQFNPVQAQSRDGKLEITIEPEILGKGEVWFRFEQ